jgi:antirestriction protein ArdC
MASPTQPTPREVYAATLLSLTRQDPPPWRKPWRGPVWAPYNPVSGALYRGINRLTLAAAGQPDPRWLTSGQLDLGGYQVQKGAKAQTIEVWRQSSPALVRDANGQPIYDHAGQPQTVQITLPQPRVHYLKVYNATQLVRPEGDQLPAPEPRRLTWDPNELAEKIIKASGVSLIFDQEDRAFYDTDTDTIHLPSQTGFTDQDTYYGTVFHELGHATRLAHRLSRPVGPYGSRDYAREEIRAEMASWMLCQDLGLSWDINRQASYLAEWLKSLTQDHHELVRAATEAEAIKDYLWGLIASPKLTPPPLPNPSLRAPTKISHYQTPRPTLFRAKEFPNPPDPLPLNYDFSEELVPRREALNRLIGTLLRPGLVTARLQRWRDFLGHLTEIDERHWSRCADFKSFLREATRIARVEIDLALQARHQSVPLERQEITVYNGVLSVIQAARGLELPDLAVNAPRPGDPNPFCRVVSVGRVEPGAEPLRILVLGQLVDIFQEKPVAQASRHLALDQENRLLAIFLSPTTAQDFAKQLSSNQIDLLTEAQAAEKASLWANRQVVQKTKLPDLSLSPEETARWWERLRRRPTPEPAPPRPMPWDEPWSSPTPPDPTPRPSPGSGQPPGQSPKLEETLWDSLPRPRPR